MGKSANPATAHLKAEKARQIKKSKAQITERRTERLAGRNPARIEKAIAELKASEVAGRITGGEREKLKRLEKELVDVERAKRKRPYGGDGDRRGNREQTEGDGGQRGTKRRWEDDGESTDEETRRIPMPSGTPPPIPAAVMERLTAERRQRWEKEQRRRREEGPHALPAKPGTALASIGVEVKKTYGAEPVIRDLRKEAIKAFVPTNVRRSKPAAPTAATQPPMKFTAENLDRRATVEEDMDEIADGQAMVELAEEEEEYLRSHGQPSQQQADDNMNTVIGPARPPDDGGMEEDVEMEEERHEAFDDAPFEELDDEALMRMAEEEEEYDRMMNEREGQQAGSGLEDERKKLPDVAEAAQVAPAPAKLANRGLVGYDEGSGSEEEW